MSTQVVGGVFISYSSDDRPIVTAAARLLRAAGARVFQDVVDLEFGSHWERALMQALDECERVMVFWSASAARSVWVEREWRCALQAGKRVVPMQLDKTPLPPALAELHGVPDLVDMLRGAMQPAPAPVGSALGPAALPRGARAAALAVPLLAVVAGLGWWLQTGGPPPAVTSPSPDDFGRGVPSAASAPASAAATVADLALPALPWLLLGAALLLGLGLAGWRWRRHRRASKPADAVPDTPSLPEEDLAELGARFTAALFHDPSGR